ncbi:MAG TPA: SLC13 family permease [Hyphomicrobiaceae bacterium]|nr:SLC13 family permease [Hyphomicrobiaceae bacterium]
MSDIAIIGLLIACLIVLFATNRLPVVVVAMATPLALWATGLLSLENALSGFGDPAVIFIAALFVVSAGLEQSGVTAWAGQFLIAKAGEESRARLLLLTMLLVAVLTALISVNGAVAALLPVVVVMAVRLKRAPSQMLMPLVFAAHAGSLLALTGTPVNVLVSEAATDAGLPPFEFFEFALAGVPLLAGTMAIIILFGQRLLPERSGRSLPSDFSKHARTLLEQYGLSDGLFRMRVKDTSPLVGQATGAIDLKDFGDLQIAGFHERGGSSPLRRGTLEPGDYVIVRGHAEDASEFALANHLAIRDDDGEEKVEEVLFNRNSGLAEVMIPPRSALIGEAVFPGMVTRSGDLLIIAIQRDGREVSEARTKLRAGDTLLLQGTWKALDVRLDDPNVLVVNSPELVRRQAVSLGSGAAQAIVVLLAMVILLATGLVPPAVAGLLAAGGLVLTNVLNVAQAYRSINWTTVILVAAMMPLSQAMVETGAAKFMAEGLVSMVGGAGPYALLAGLFLLTAILGQLISNTATALIVIPIGVAAAAQIGVSPRPVLMSLSVGAAAAFLTPIATPTNLMVMEPGGYTFGDYWKLGLPLLIWFFVVATFYVPVVWRL